MNNPASIGLMIAVLTPLISILASLAKQEHWPKSVNAIIAMLIAGAGGAGVVATTGGFDHLSTVANLVATCSTVITASQAFYYLIFKNSQIDMALADWPAGPSTDPVPAPEPVTPTIVPTPAPPAPPAPPVFQRKQGS